MEHIHGEKEKSTKTPAWNGLVDLVDPDCDPLLRSFHDHIICDDLRRRRNKTVVDHAAAALYRSPGNRSAWYVGMEAVGPVPLCHHRAGIDGNHSDTYWLFNLGNILGGHTAADHRMVAAW